MKAKTEPTIQALSSTPQHIPISYAPVVAAFTASIEADADFVQVVTRAQIGERCGLWLRGTAAKVWGEDLPCLATALDVLGNWTAVTLTGAVVQFLGDEVA